MAGARAPTPPNEAQKFLPYAILANLLEFQIILEQSIFIVHKRLPYKKASIFDGECDGKNLSDLLNYWEI